MMFYLYSFDLPLLIRPGRVWLLHRHSVPGSWVQHGTILVDCGDLRGQLHPLDVPRPWNTSTRAWAKLVRNWLLSFTKSFIASSIIQTCDLFKQLPMTSGHNPVSWVILDLWMIVNYPRSRGGKRGHTHTWMLNQSWLNFKICLLHW